MTSESNKLLKQIAEHLILYSILPYNLGLLNGKMGIIIFFYHYSSHQKNSIYNDFADTLLDELFEEIHDQLPINFKNGYLGIGWGIEYLLEQNFVKGNTKKILEDIDKKIMERDVRRISDISLNTGLEGILHYVIFRLCNNHGKVNLFDEWYLYDLHNIVNSTNSKSSKNLAKLCENYIHWYENNTPPQYRASIFLEDFYSTELQNTHTYKGKTISNYLNTGLNLLK